MKRNRNGKIVATIGPASSSYERLEKLFLSGVDVFRLNFSHGAHEGHEKVFNAIRTIGQSHGCHPTILADLQGPKLRVGTFENDRIILEAGDVFRFDLDTTPGNTTRVNLPHPEILEVLQSGSILLLDDGKLRFQVITSRSDYADMKVVVGGPLSNRKGVNVPDVMLPIPALTEKDRRDLDFALGLGVDWVALSFVQNVEDILDAKKIINGRAGVVAKLEKPLAIKALEPIVEASDAVMVARGDLGVEMDLEEVPAIQRRIVKTCLRLGRPVIVATQMLESMISCPTPTRAEVSDIASAVYSGADATMLSAESASGQYPVESVSIMGRVVGNVESDSEFLKHLEDGVITPQQTSLDAICMAAKNAAEYSGASAIVLFTDSFETVVRCSRLRPAVPILLAADTKLLASKAGICRGVFSTLVKKEFSMDQITKTAKTIALDRKFANAGDNVVVLSDISENFVQVCRLPS